MVATQLAFRVTEILTKYCPKVIDVTFTRELESKMEQIEVRKADPRTCGSRNDRLSEPIVEGLKTKEEEIGRELTHDNQQHVAGFNTLSVPCPKCGSKLRVVKNPKTKKRFIGCSGRWEKKCTFSLPLPQLGALTLLEKRCPECGFQMVQVRVEGTASDDLMLKLLR